MAQTERRLGSMLQEGLVDAVIDRAKHCSAMLYSLDQNKRAVRPLQQVLEKDHVWPVPLDILFPRDRNRTVRISTS